MLLTIHRSALSSSDPTSPTSSSRIDDGEVEPLNLIIEVTGEHRREKAAKVATAQTYWIPAVNNHGGLGRWSFLEVSDPWDAANLIRAHVASLANARS